MSEQLTYTPQASNVNEHPHTMVLLVDPDMLQKYRGGDTSIPLAAIVDSFEIFKFDTPGKEGRLVHPSKAELQSAFDTTNETKIVRASIARSKIAGGLAPRMKSRHPCSMKLIARIKLFFFHMERERVPGPGMKRHCSRLLPLTVKFRL